MVDNIEASFKEFGYRDIEIKEKYKILIITDSGVGDFIQASSSIKEIRRMYPGAYITLVMHPRGVNLADACPYVDEVHAINLTGEGTALLDQILYIIEFTKENLLYSKIDIAFCLGTYFCSVLLAYMSGARRGIASDRAYVLDGAAANEPLKGLVTDIIEYRMLRPRYAGHFLSLIDGFKGIPVCDRKPEI